MTTRNDIIGRGIFDVFPDNPADPHADGVRNLRASLERVFKNRLPDTMPVQKYDIRRPASEGGFFEERYWSPVNSPVLGNNDELIYIIHRVEDITEFIRLKQAGSEQGKLTEELRTRAERMEAEVYARERELEDVNRKRLESIGRLAGGIAHDFNNLLGIILGYAKLLEDRSITEENAVKHGLKQIQEAAERAACLTRQLLAYSRQQVLEPRVLDLNSVIKSIEPLVKRLIGANIDFQTVLSGYLDPIKADPGQIEQVIMNLIINARDAMPNGGKLIVETCNVEADAAYIKQHKGVTPGPYVMLSISDTGTGIDKATLDRIFEPFFTTKERGKGTGLGLATVHGIVRQSGGYIWVYSEPGVGTTFKVYLPMACEPAKPNLVRPRPTPKACGSETILVVEDQPVLRGLMRTMLEADGYSVLCAAAPAEALKEVHSYKGTIHLLITDVILPGMNGRALAEELATTRPGIKVLFVSAYTENVVMHHGELDAGFNFLQKPFTQQSLIGKLREVLDGQSVV
jgi:signal transduction histidine kinase